MTNYKHTVLKNILTGVLLLVWVSLYVANDGLTENVNNQSFDNYEKSTTKEDQKEIPTIELSDALQHTVQINLNFQSFLLGEITLDEINERFTSFLREAQKTVSKSIITILRRIISPNAP